MTPEAREDILLVAWFVLSVVTLLAFTAWSLAGCAPPPGVIPLPG